MTMNPTEEQKEALTQVPSASSQQKWKNRPKKVFMLVVNSPWCNGYLSYMVKATCIELDYIPYPKNFYVEIISHEHFFVAAHNTPWYVYMLCVNSQNWRMALPC